MGKRYGKLGVLDGAALVVSTVIGAGIFTVPSLIASLTGSASGFIAVWIGGGLLAVAGALSYAELAARFPDAGGEYVYLREAFGPVAGFLSGWTSFIAGFSGAIAASAVGFARYVTPIWPAVGGAPLARFGMGAVSVTISPTTLVAVALILAFTTVAVAGLESSRRTNNALAVLLVLGVVAFVTAGVVRLPATPAAAATASVNADGIMGIAAALVPVMFTYSGWNAAAYVANEFDAPRRTVPRALALGAAVVTVLYVALNVTYLRALSLGGVAGTPTPGEGAAAVILGTARRNWLTPVVLAALASSVCAMVITGPRIYLQMARDGAMPGAFARVRERDGFPVTSIVLQSVWSCVLVLTGTFEAIVTYTGFAVVLFAGAAVASVFVFRRRDVQPWDGYRVWGFPVVPALFVIASALMLQATIAREPFRSLAGLALMAAGLPLYVWWKRGVGSDPGVRARGRMTGSDPGI
jgi:APA family basic amino acid/polyamine antiporter